MSQTDALHPPRPAALIIGAGIAGIQAALDIADAGYHVYLVEREPSVGGRMAQLDKTFPTLDCSSCILTPKMVDVGRHPNITLLTYSEVEWVKRDGGRFQVRVRKKARSVDEDKCTGCGVCTEHCIVRNAPYIRDLIDAAGKGGSESGGLESGGSESEGPEE
jgi:heterodisulfide reductase subunit A